jgi:glycerol kinase
VPAPAQGLLTTIAWGVRERVDYALEAAIFVTGAAVQWLRDELGIIRSADETEGLARSLDSNDGVYLVPAFTGLGSPHWDAYARGTLVGLTRGAGRPHLARAALEAMAYQTVDAVRAMEVASGVVLEELKADGGAVVNGWLMKFQADALGAAYLAGVATGTWSEQDVRAMWRQAARYEPSMSEEERASLLAGWARALERARSNEADRSG